MRTLFSISLLLGCVMPLSAQQRPSVFQDSLMAKMARQIALYPQERIHVQIDRPAYVPGDTLWLRAYLVDGVFLTQNARSRYVTAELISPLDSLVSRVKLRVNEDRSFSGYVSLPRNLADGQYTLRAYTSYMLPEGEDAFFRRRVDIVSPRWLNLRTVVNATSDRTRKGYLDMELRHQSGSSFKPAQADMDLKWGRPDALKLTNGRISVTLPPKEIALNRAFRLNLTDGNGNRFSRYLPLSGDKVDFSVSFFPEGGYLVAGQPSRMAFEALDRSGNVSEVTVSVLDQNGDTVATDSTFYKGMGLLFFTPQKGVKYKAYATAPDGLTKSFEVPEAVSAPGLQVDTDAKRIKVRLLRDESQKSDELYFAAQVRGAVCFADKWDNNSEELVFYKQLFPAGVVRLTLMDKNRQVIAERLVWNNLPSGLKTEVRTVRQKYAPRSLVKMSVGVTDRQGKPVKASLSMAVTDASDTSVDSCFQIRTSLWLTPELKGYVENPSYYLGQGWRAIRAADLLMMTQGWRRYDLGKIWLGQYDKPQREPETSFAVSGTVKKFSPLEGRKKYMVFIQGTNNSFSSFAETDEKKHFSFKNIEYPEGMGFTLRAAATKNNKGNQEIILDKEDTPTLNACVPQYKVDGFGQTVARYIPGKSLMRQYELPPLVVKAKMWGTSDYDRYSNEEINSGKQKTVKDFLEEMGIKVTEKQNPDASARSDYMTSLTDTKPKNGRTYDNLPDIYRRFLYQYFYYKGTKVVVFINNQTTNDDPGKLLVYGTALNDIKEITLLKDVKRDIVNDFARESEDLPKSSHLPDNILYSMYDIPLGKKTVPVLDVRLKVDNNLRYSGFRTLQGNLYESSMDRRTVYPLGYQKPVEFYAPQYDTEAKLKSDKPDTRKTIYWKPVINIDGKTLSEISFYTSDRPSTSYNVVIEGVSERGELIHEVRKIVVE